MVLREADRRGWPPAPGAALAFVTAGLEMQFHRPAPLGEPVALTAELIAVAESEMTVLSQMHHDGESRATGTAVWKRWRARS